MRFDESFEFFASRRCWSKHAAVCVHPNARAALFCILDHLYHVRVQHWLAAAGAAHPRVVLPTLARDALPEFDGEEIAITLAVELAYLRVAVGVWTHRTTEVAGVDDGHHHHERKLLRPRPQAVVIAFRSFGIHHHVRIKDVLL